MDEHYSATHADLTLQQIIRAADDFLSRADVYEEYGIPPATQCVWHSHKRYGWRDLAYHIGRTVRYRRADIEAWFKSRKGGLGEPTK